MLHASRELDSIDSIVSFFSGEKVNRAIAGAGSILVQRFWSGLLVLVVRDDGIGLPADPGPEGNQGFGLSLARALAAQLDASFSARSDRGAVFELRMPL